MGRVFMDYMCTGTGYPREWQVSDRRAREVIPEAMRAEVRIIASAATWHMRAGMLACSGERRKLFSA